MACGGSSARRRPHDSRVTPRSAIRIERVSLALAEDLLPAVARFYLDELGLEGEVRGRTLRLAVGPATLGFEAQAGIRRPFYHHALLVPGNRFEAARAWLDSHAALLARPGGHETVFDFEAWDARACYAHDPASNILELIAHHGLAVSPESGCLAPGELRGISEIGVVTADPPAALERLRSAGLELWSGEASDRPTALGFVGRKAHTLILCPPGRPWLPTGRPAETHPLEVLLGADGSPAITVRVDQGHALEVSTV